MPEADPKFNPITLLQAEARRDLQLQSLHHEEVILDTQGSLYDPAEIGLPRQSMNGEQIEIIGEAAIGGDGGIFGEMAFVRSGTTSRGKIFLVELAKDEKGQSIATGHWRSLNPSESVVIGRGSGAHMHSLGGRSLDDVHISRKHLTVTLTPEGLKLKDTSTNGSAFRGKKVSPEDKYDYTATHTVSAEEAARRRGLLKEQSDGGRSEFGGRPTIGRDTFPIDGHVDIRSWVAGKEAIVVDSKKYPEEFNQLRDLFVANLHKEISARQGGHIQEEDVLKAIYRSVHETLQYDLEFVKKEAQDVRSASPESRKAALNNYLAAGKGVCRHMALTAAWLGGEAYKQGLVRGKFTTEVNQSDLGYGAHEWSRYMAPDGEIYIIDVAQHFVGKLADTLDRKPSGREYWGYFRSKEERDTYRQAKQGSTIVTLSGLEVRPTLPQRIIDSKDVPK